MRMNLCLRKRKGWRQPADLRIGNEILCYLYIASLSGGVVLLDILRYIITPDYWPGLKVVPIVMAAEMFMGVYFNLSFWYKLIDETRWGAYFSLIGCVIIVLLNIIFVPVYGYIACAWGRFSWLLHGNHSFIFRGAKEIPY
jgi:O-antigen/teichoic acid export membrane protein